MKELIGKKIDGLYVSNNQDVIVFMINAKRYGKNQISYSAHGECCSESWWADITDIDNIINQTIVSVKKIPMNWYNTEDGRSRQEEDSAYGFRLTTSKGDCDVIFRNSSNGYYGGWCEYFKKIFSDEFLDHEFEKLNSLKEWRA